MFKGHANYETWLVSGELLGVSDLNKHAAGMADEAWDARNAKLSPADQSAYARQALGYNLRLWYGERTNDDCKPWAALFVQNAFDAVDWESVADDLLVGINGYVSRTELS